MRIAFLVTRLDKPSARYRVIQYLPYLQEAGWETEVFALPKNYQETTRLFERLRSVDVVFLQKKLLSPRPFSLLRRHSRRLVYDFDDAVMYRDSWKRRHRSFKRRWAFARTVREADRVIAGNRYLEERAKGYAGKVTVIPTPIPLERYAVKDDSFRSATTTLGWIGSAATVNYLELIYPVLETLSARFPDVRVKIVSDSFPPLDQIPVEKKLWKSDEEIIDLHSFAVGLMPLTDDVWSRGKCGFKLLQYMAAGIPVVCSPVGMNREIVEDGVQGFWASAQEEWTEKLSRLIQDPDLRQQMGAAGRRRVAERYSLSVMAPKLLDVLHPL